MKQIVGTLFTTGALLFTVNSAQAIQVSDINPADTYFGPTSVPLVVQSYTGTFTLPAPFDPAGWNVVSAYAEFDFSDLDLDFLTGGDKFSVTLDGGESLNKSNVPFGVDWSGLIATLTVDFTPIGTIALDELQDGLLQYTINWERGTFVLIEARLFAEIQPVPTQNVPDGGATIALLGLGMAGLAGIRRKAALK